MVAIDLHEEKLELARELGAEFTVRALEQVNESIADVEAGRVAARIVFQP